jgi:DNA replication protein DnaC
MKEVLKMGELQRISTVRQLTLPQRQFERLGGRPTAAEVARTCPTCGTDIPPVSYTNGWIPGRCVCEQKRIEKAQLDKISLEQGTRESEKLRMSCDSCYTWLGEDIDSLRSKTFENYQRALFPDAFEKLRSFTRMRDIHGNTIVPWRNIFIFGSIGTGKTHLMSAAINALCDQHIPCRFMTGQGLFDQISSCFSNRYDHTHYLNEAANAPVLAIDDIDKVYIPERVRESEENFQVKTFFAILNKRYLKQLPTLITTNSHDVTKYIGAAAFSRLKEGGEVIQMDGSDYRDTLLRW